MKKVFKWGFKISATLLSYFYSYGICVRFEEWKNKIVSIALARKMKFCGNNFQIDRPFTLAGTKYISIGNNVHLHSDIRLEAVDKFLDQKFIPSIKIGNNVIINQYCHFGVVSSLTIEDGVLIAGKVFITDHYHGKTDLKDLQLSPANRDLYCKGPVRICKNAWIGENVSIMPNVTIGENVIVGANSVVTKDIPRNAVVAGVPAKIVRIM